MKGDLDQCQIFGGFSVSELEVSFSRRAYAARPDPGLELVAIRCSELLIATCDVSYVVSGGVRHVAIHFDSRKKKLY